jgi:hypothetical protein
MLVKELKAIYKLEAEYYRQDVNEADFNVWKGVLLFYEEDEVKRALSRWHGDDTWVDGLGRTQGSFFPKASDIRGIVETAKRKEAESDEFKACNRVQQNVDVRGTSWPELFCSGGQLYLHTVDYAGNQAVRPMRNCDCWLNRKATA